MTNQTSESSIVALDVGDVRIGLARAYQDLALASPLTWLPRDEHIFAALQEVFQEHQASAIVVGLPRNLNGEDTNQTRAVRQFVEQLKPHVDVPVYWQDEALTSRKAEDELQARNKPFDKGDIDVLAACFILEDFIATDQKVPAV